MSELIKKIRLPAPFDAAFLNRMLGKKTGPQVQAPSSRIACDFGKSKVVFTEIEKSSEGLRLMQFHKIARPAQGKDGEMLKEFFDKGLLSSKKIRISVKGQGVVIRFVQFPQMNLADLKSAISFEIDQYIPFKIHEVVWDCQILEENIAAATGAVMNVLLVAVKREDLYATLQIFQNAGLQVELIDADALALINVLDFFHPEDIKNPVAILDIGTEVSTLSVTQQSKPRFIRDITYGGVDILKRIRRKLGLTQELAVQQIEVDREPTPEASAVIKEALNDLVSELRVSLNYYLDQVPASEPVKKLFIAGGGGYHPLVIETLTQSLGFPVEIIQMLGKLQLGPLADAELIKKNEGILPVALGLCLRDL